MMDQLEENEKKKQDDDEMVRKVSNQMSEKAKEAQKKEKERQLRLKAREEKQCLLRIAHIFLLS